ncbi:MAG: hypothetical protein AB7K09_08155 [Planctomycetota bacterium]
MNAARLPRNVDAALSADDLEGALDASLTDLLAYPDDRRAYAAFHQLILDAADQFGHEAVADELLTRDESAHTHAAMAILHHLAGERRECRNSARRALDLDPAHPIAQQFAFDGERDRKAHRRAVAAEKEDVRRSRAALPTSVVVILILLYLTFRVALRVAQPPYKPPPESLQPDRQPEFINTPMGPARVIYNNSSRNSRGILLPSNRDDDDR